MTETSPNFQDTSSTALEGQLPTVESSILPGEIRVVKRCGDVVPFDSSKISNAIWKAFKASSPNITAEDSSAMRDKVAKYSAAVEASIQGRSSTGRITSVEEIQDQVELTMMREGEYAVAKSYILYRNEHQIQRQSLRPTKQENPEFSVTRLKDSEGNWHEIQWPAHKAAIKRLCENYDLDAAPITERIEKNIFPELEYSEFHKLIVMSIRELFNRNHDYTFVASRMMIFNIEAEVCKQLSIPFHSAFPLSFEEKQARLDMYKEIFIKGLEYGVEVKRINPALLDFDLDYLTNLIDPERDFGFKYLGLQTLYDRYFLRKDSNHSSFELPQTMMMRIAMGLCLNETDKNQRVKEIYEGYSKFLFMSSTPTLFNSGTLSSQLSSCYLTTVPDDLAGIFDSYRDNALLSKWAGGLGNDWTNIRASGGNIKGTGGKSQGVVPFLRIANDGAVAVNQGGKRKGAVCSYLETWHMDIMDYLVLRKNSGDERGRTPDMNTANWIPDLFMHRLEADLNWTLFDPVDCPDLHDLYGLAFKERYEHYEQMLAEGNIRGKSMPAKELWRMMMNMLNETGHPWITFKDPCNIRSPQSHVGVVHSSNLCTEITLNTSAVKDEEEIAVCNLASINIAAHIKDGAIDSELLKSTVTTTMRALDNVIDLNFYPVEASRRSNIKHRPVGMGIMGFQDALYQLDIAYQSAQAIEMADKLQEEISYYAIEASSDLAAERAPYSSFEGSRWSKGQLPLDTLKLLEEDRNGLQQDARAGQRDQDALPYAVFDFSQSLDWDNLRKKVQRQGMRNSNTMAIAPTATIANIIGVQASIEPQFSHLFSKSNLSGNFAVLNPYLEKELSKLGLWDDTMRTDILHFDGIISDIKRIPEDIKEVYKTSFEIDQNYLVLIAARRQKWIDQAQSLNLYFKTNNGEINGKPSGVAINQVYRNAWRFGLKTTYYQRNTSSTQREKSTVHNTQDLNTVSAQSNNSQPLACAIDDPDCEACQ